MREGCADKYIRGFLRDLRGYTPGEQPTEVNEYIKLNTNENPYPPSPHVLIDLSVAANDQLKKYPNPVAEPVRRKLAEIYKMPVECTMVGNGSDELLSLIFRAFVERADVVHTTFPTYVLYSVLIGLADAREQRHEIGTSDVLPETMLNAVGKLALISSPNAPTGVQVSVESVGCLCEQFDGLVVLDEAYVDFAAVNGLGLIGRHKNLIVLRTMSKSFSLAGMRIGYVFAAPDIIDVLMKVKDSYNLNRLSQVAALAALNDYTWMEQNVERICNTREQVRSMLMELGCDVPRSQANFLWVKPPADIEAYKLYQCLKSEKVLVRWFDEQGLREGIRVTIGTELEMKLFVGNFKGCVARLRNGNG